MQNGRRPSTGSRDFEIPQAYRDLEQRLRAEGFRVWVTCPYVPVQLAGELPSGEAFCFHCRHERCSLSLAPAGGDPVRAPEWEQTVSRWDDCDAGLLEAAEAESVLRDLLGRYMPPR